MFGDEIPKRRAAERVRIHAKLPKNKPSTELAKITVQVMFDMANCIGRTR